MRETGYAAWPSLRPQFWLPLFLDAGPSGRFWGGATAGSDAVGRFNYIGAGLLALQPVRAIGWFAGRWSGLGNPTLDVSASSEWDDLRAPVTLSERTQEGALGATFVARRWRTFASVRLAAEFKGTQFVAIPDTSLATICPACNGRDLAGGSVTLPLALVGAPFGHLPLGADKLWLNLFGDAGDAWDAGQAPRLTRLRSTGAELAGDFTINYDFLLQVRLGVAAPLADPPSGAARRPHVYMGLASDF